MQGTKALSWIRNKEETLDKYIVGKKSYSNFNLTQFFVGFTAFAI